MPKKGSGYMALQHTFVFTKTIIEWEKFSKATQNRYQVVSVREYSDKKGNRPDGYSLTLMVLKDNLDYGVNANTGEPRDNNEFVNFDVTVFSRKEKIVKGDIISLEQFDPDNSFVIGFDLILRFKDFKILESKR